MSQRSLFWPISIIIVCCMFVVGPFVISTAAPFAQDDEAPCETTSAEYNICRAQKTFECATIPANDSRYPACVQTRVANDVTRGVITVTPSRTGTATSAVQATAPPVQNTSTATLGSATATRTVTTTTTARTATATTSVAPTVSSGPTLAPTDPVTAVTPTPIAGEQCPSGQPFTLAGEGPPDTPLVVSFDPLAGEGTPTPSSERIVAGGRSDANGLYRIVLLMGDEKPGPYEIEVRVRATRELLDTTVCIVPAPLLATLTP
jgi:hypothetical protein